MLTDNRTSSNSAAYNDDDTRESHCHSSQQPFSVIIIIISINSLCHQSLTGWRDKKIRSSFKTKLWRSWELINVNFSSDKGFILLSRLTSTSKNNLPSVHTLPMASATGYNFLLNLQCNKITVNCGSKPQPKMPCATTHWAGSHVALLNVTICTWTALTNQIAFTHLISLRWFILQLGHCRTKKLAYTIVNYITLFYVWPPYHHC